MWAAESIAASNELRDGAAGSTVEILRRPVQLSIVEHRQYRAFGPRPRRRTRLDGKLHPRSPSLTVRPLRLARVAATQSGTPRTPVATAARAGFYVNGTGRPRPVQDDPVAAGGGMDLTNERGVALATAMATRSIAAIEHLDGARLVDELLAKARERPEQVRQVLEGTQELQFRAAEDDEGRYGWIDAVLRRLGSLDAVLAWPLVVLDRWIGAGGETGPLGRQHGLLRNGVGSAAEDLGEQCLQGVAAGPEDEAPFEERLRRRVPACAPISASPTRRRRSASG
mgnify:CR=1 FL=1